MDPGAAPSLTTAAIPALVSTGITVLYLFLKLLSYITNATPCTPEKQDAEGADGQMRYTQQKRRSEKTKALAKFVNKTQKTFFTREEMAQGGPPPPQGPYFYQENGKTYFSPPSHMVSGIMNCNHYRQMMQDCAKEGIPVPHHVMAKDPQAHIMTPAQYLQQVIQELAKKSKNMPQDQQPAITVLEFRDFERPPPAQTPGPSNRQ